MSGGRAALPSAIPPLPAGVKPTYPVVVDWTYPLAKGLVDYSLCEQMPPTNLVTGKRFSAYVAGAGEKVRDFLDLSAASAGVTAGAPTANFITGYPFSMFLDFQREPDGSAGAGVSYSTSSAANGSLILEYDLAVGLRGAVYTDAGQGGAYNSITKGGGLSDRIRYRAVFVAPSSDKTTWKLFLDGDRVDSGVSGTATFPNGMNRHSIGMLNRASPVYYGGYHWSCGSWSRALTDSEAKALTLDPYQFLKPAGP